MFNADHTEYTSRHGRVHNGLHRATVMPISECTSNACESGDKPCPVPQERQLPESSQPSGGAVYWMLHCLGFAGIVASFLLLESKIMPAWLLGGLGGSWFTCCVILSRIHVRARFHRQLTAPHVKPWEDPRTGYPAPRPDSGGRWMMVVIGLLTVLAIGGAIWAGV